MSTIRCVYHDREPDFPARDQHPDAVRYKVGAVWVDAIGGRPTPAEVDAVLHPPPAPPEPMVRDLIAALQRKGMITDQELAALAPK